MPPPLPARSTSDAWPASSPRRPDLTPTSSAPPWCSPASATPLAARAAGLTSRTAERREGSCLAPAPHFVPRVADRVFELVPRALVAYLPVAPGLQLEGCPVVAGIAWITGELVAVAIARGPALVGMTPTGEAGGVVAAEVRLVPLDAPDVPCRRGPHGFDLHLG